MDTNGRALPRRLNHKRNGKCRPFTSAESCPLGSRYACLFKFFLRFYFVKRCLARPNTVAGIGNPAPFLNLLHLAVVAEGSVQSDEGQLCPGRQLEILIPDIDLENVGAER